MVPCRQPALSILYLPHQDQGGRGQCHTARGIQSCRQCVLGLVLDVLHRFFSPTLHGLLCFNTRLEQTMSRQTEERVYTIG
jgi:hypothetical protein